MSFINITSALSSTYALAIAFGILFIETSLPLIIGLPGDTLLISGGLFAAGIGVPAGAQHFSIIELAIGAPIAAIIGSQLGHFLGWHFGVRIFNRPKSKLFSPDKLNSAEKWVGKYGHGKAIVLGRFVPVVRGLVNPISGMIRIPFKTFAFWNVVGALIWTQVLIWGGYAVGKQFADVISKYLTYIILGIAVVTILPLALEIFKEWRTRKHLS
jgi:membrane-associated protein